MEGELRGVARYRALFANDHAGSLFVWSIVARMPLGMAALSLVLLVRHSGAGYGAAGLVAALFGIGTAAGAPYGGRQVDRRGARRILSRRMVIFPALVALVALLGATGAPTVALAVAAAAAGLTLAPVSAVLRSIWPEVAGSDGAKTAYALDAALQEMIWVGGPLIVAVLAAVSPTVAVAGVAAIAAVGTFCFVRIPPVATSAPAEERHESRLGALSAVGVRTIAAFALCLGLGFGSLEIAVPAFAEIHGDRALAGVCLAGFAAGSLVGGLVAGLRPMRDERRRIVFGTFALAALVSLPLLASSIPTMTVLLFVAGFPIAPVVAAIYGVVGHVAAAGSVAEAFSWFGTAIGLGIALGSVMGGALIDAHGWRASATLAIGCMFVAALLVTLRRGTLVAASTGSTDAA